MRMMLQDCTAGVNMQILVEGFWGPQNPTLNRLFCPPFSPSRHAVHAARSGALQISPSSCSQVGSEVSHSDKRVLGYMCARTFKRVTERI